MKNKDQLLKKIKDDTNHIPVPESVTPEGVCKTLEEYDRWNQVISYNETGSEAVDDKNEKRESKRPSSGKSASEKLENGKRKSYWKILAAAACLCLVLGSVIAVGLQVNNFNKTLVTEHFYGENGLETKDSDIEEIKAQDVFAGKHTTYAAIYASMEEVWEEENRWRKYVYDMGADVSEEEVVVEEAAAEMPAADSSMDDAFATDGSNVIFEEEKSASSSAYGTTNVQTVGVDEGDIVKNDGRYLYQLISFEEETYQYKQAIQIVDTKEGLTELARIGDFESVAEFYIWEDMLVVIENKYLDNFETLESGAVACYDVAYFANEYHEISIYNIKDRSNPEKLKTFTLKGSYQSSRIANGYFYGFSRFYASQGKGEEDYDAYIPVVDGERLEEEQLFLPEGSEGTSYFVIVSIDLRNPMEFVQTAGIVTDSEQYYVSSNNIYVTDTKYADANDAGTEVAGAKDGWSCDKTALLRFTYKDGYFALQAEGEINGSIDDTFSLDEYDNHLRVVTTVREYKYETITDDRTGEVMGSSIEEERQTNALYILDDQLNLTGKIEGLAENEQIYSTRFMGNTGYFVTFRQTDPLFVVDLTDPVNPKILSELKVSGFSEYLHFYGEGLLFGLGMEADEETGMQEGMKLSMFDISDPANVQEITRLPLDDYYYSEALYNHNAVLIHPSVNLIGFEAEGSDSGDYWKNYLVYSYENGVFVEKLKLNTETEDGRCYSARGTFIGNTFYLLTGDGSVKSYDLNTGDLLESLVHEG